MQLDLSEQEQQALTELVRDAHADINPEIHHAMGHEYREQLRQRKALLEGLLKRLGADQQLHA
jgi:hypothetical protein